MRISRTRFEANTGPVQGRDPSLTGRHAVFVEGVRGCSSWCWARRPGSGSRATSACRPSRRPRRRCSAASLGYVGGGMLGRLLDRALGAVERRVERRPPAQFVAGTLGAIAGASGRRVLVRAAGRRSLPARVGRPDRGPPRVDHGLAGLPHPRQPERRGARDARPVDAAARARRRRSTRATGSSSTPPS